MYIMYCTMLDDFSIIFLKAVNTEDEIALGILHEVPFEVARPKLIHALKVGVIPKSCTRFYKRMSVISGTSPNSSTAGLLNVAKPITNHPKHHQSDGVYIIYLNGR